MHSFRYLIRTPKVSPSYVVRHPITVQIRQSSILSKVPSVSIPGREQFLEFLPKYASDTKMPKSAWAALITSLIPLGFGTYWIHSEKDPGPREVMRMEIHYLSATLTYAGAIHWGLVLAEFAMPATSPYMAIYYFMRFGLPIVPLSLAWLASSMSAMFPRDSVLWLGTGYGSLLGFDFLAHITCTVPAWYIRARLLHSVGVFIGLGGMLLSEAMLEMGRNPQLVM